MSCQVIFTSARLESFKLSLTDIQISKQLKGLFANTGLTAYQPDYALIHTSYLYESFAFIMFYFLQNLHKLPEITINWDKPFPTLDLHRVTYYANTLHDLPYCLSRAKLSLFVALFVSCRLMMKWWDWKIC